MPAASNNLVCLGRSSSPFSRADFQSAHAWPSSLPHALLNRSSFTRYLFLCLAPRLMPPLPTNPARVALVTKVRPHRNRQITTMCATQLAIHRDASWIVLNVNYVGHRLHRAAVGT